MSRVLFSHIKKRYSGNPVLAVNDLSLEVEDREFVVLVGPSGCGKSTTLKMVAGLESVTDGDIYIGDELVNDLPPKDRDIAMVFQNYALYPNMNVFENIAFGLRLRKTPKYLIEEKVQQAARILGIDHLLERLPAHLSGGQKQRVAVGRAIVRNPKVFLMDEPLSNLDARMRVTMRSELIKLHRSLDVTSVYVTHDQTEAVTMGDRIVVMDTGVMQQVGTPEEIYHEPDNLFVANFIGSPPMNFVRGRLMESDDNLEFYTGKITLKVPEEKKVMLDRMDYFNRDVIMGIRPENISLARGRIDRLERTTIRGKIQMSEFFGSDRYIYMDIDSDNSIVGRINSREKVEDDSVIDLYVNMNNALFFDINSKERVI